MNSNIIDNPVYSPLDLAPNSDVLAVGVKVLIVDLSREFGGASSRVLTLMRNFPADQVAIAVLAESPIEREVRRLSLPVVVVGKNKANPLILFRLISTIRNGRYQLLDTQNPQSKFWGSLAAWLTGISLVSTLNSWYVDEHGKNSIKGVLYALLELGTNFSLDRYVVVSKSIFNALVRHRVDPSKIHLIYNAVDVGIDIPSSRESLLAKLNIPVDSTLIATAGRFVWAKGFDDLVDAFRIVASEKPNVYCLIAGDGELFFEIKSRIETAGLKDRVILLGQLSRDEVYSLIKSCDVFVMSSRSEGTPMVLLEAASLKKPILATNVGGISELLKDEEECLLVPPGNLNAFAQGMIKILTEKKLSERMAQAAFLRVTRDFSVRNQVKDTLSAYAQALPEQNLV